MTVTSYNNAVRVGISNVSIVERCYNKKLSESDFMSSMWFISVMLANSKQIYLPEKNTNAI